MKSLAHLFLSTVLVPAILQGIPYRAGYRYGFGIAYSAAVDLPRYQIVDLGAGRVPVDVNDHFTVILRDADNHLLKW